MNNLIKVKKRDPDLFYIFSIGANIFKDFQIIFVHYKIIKGFEYDEEKPVEKAIYHNYEEFKNDRDILENILNNQREIENGNNYCKR